MALVPVGFGSAHGELHEVSALPVKTLAPLLAWPPKISADAIGAAASDVAPATSSWSAMSRPIRTVFLLYLLRFVVALDEKRLVATVGVVEPIPPLQRTPKEVCTFAVRQ